MRNHRPALVLACLLALLPSLAACSALPRAGSPQPFDVSVPEAAPIEFLAGGPVEGSTPVELVQDFLLACSAGSSDDYSTARLFLTRASAQQWNPLAQVQIYPTEVQPTLRSTEDDSTAGTVSVSLAVPAMASLDAEGILTRATDSTLSTSFTLVQENGQWRIDSPGDGVIVSRASFANSYEIAQLYFPSITGDALIADPRWYPSRRLATHLLEGLIAGPRDSLARVVTNAIPGGTTISSQGIEIVDQVAHVSINAVLPADPSARSLLQWQIARTLSAARTIASVEITVSGELLKVADVPEGVKYSMDSPLALTRDGLGMLSGTSVRLLDLPVQPGGDVSALAVGPVGASPVVWREGDSLIVVDPVTRLFRRIDEVGNGSDPSVDRFGWVWSANLEAGTVSAWLLNGSYTQVQLPAEGATGIRALRVSPDGARVLLTRTVGGTTGLWVGVVVRQPDGTPQALEELQPLESLGTAIVDASWAGSSTVVAIKGEQGEEQLMTADLGGFAVSSALPEGTVSLSAGSTAAQIAIAGQDGTHQSRSGALWQLLPEAVQLMRYPG